MAIKLHNKVSRETEIGINTFGKYRGKNLIASLLPPNMIEFRIKGTRQKFITTLQTCYEIAYNQFLINNYNAEMKRYESKERKRRPKKPFIPYRFKF